MMVPIRTNGNPRVFEVERWFAIVVAVLLIVGFAWGTVSNIALDRKLLKDTAALTVAHEDAIDTLETKMTKVEMLLPEIRDDVKDIKELLNSRR